MTQVHQPSQPKQQGTQFAIRYGPWAAVTGASSGIGREIARELAKDGLNLVLVARNQVALDQLASELSALYRIETRVISADLASEQGVAMVIAATQELDVGLFVAAAGFGSAGAFLHGSLDQELEMLAVNCRALLMLSHVFGQRFAQRGRGGIILLSSIVGFQGVPFSAHYSATKAYVQTLAEALHVELAPLGVDVLASAPGPTNSGFADRANMRMTMALTSTEVAQATLGALGRTATVLPGWLSKLLGIGLAPLPRWARARIMGQVMRDMTAHQLSSAGRDAATHPADAPRSGV